MLWIVVLAFAAWAFLVSWRLVRAKKENATLRSLLALASGVILMAQFDANARYNESGLVNDPSGAAPGFVISAAMAEEFLEAARQFREATDGRRSAALLRRREGTATGEGEAANSQPRRARRSGITLKGPDRLLTDDEYIERAASEGDGPTLGGPAGGGYVNHGLTPITTPGCSPESNGISEAFHHTLRRDYLAGADLSSADAIRRQLPAWVADYNSCAPHSSPGMRSPAEYRRMHERQEA